MAKRGSASWLPRRRVAASPLLLYGLIAASDGALATSVEESIEAALATNPEVGVVAADRQEQ